MRISYTLVLAILVWTATPPVFAAGAISIGGIEASLGDAEQSVIESLEEKYTVNELRTGTYVVHDGNPSENTIGVIQFKGGKLVWASRDVGAFEGAAVQAFAQSLFEVLAALEPAERTPILISVETSPSEHLKFGSITLEFPGRSVIVDIGFKDELVDASIEEILFVHDTSAKTAPKP